MCWQTAEFHWCVRSKYKFFSSWMQHRKSLNVTGRSAASCHILCGIQHSTFRTHFKLLISGSDALKSRYELLHMKSAQRKDDVWIEWDQWFHHHLPESFGISLALGLLILASHATQRNSNQELFIKAPLLYPVDCRDGIHLHNSPWQAITPQSTISSLSLRLRYTKLACCVIPTGVPRRWLPG